MEPLTKEIDAILSERFGKDSILALATSVDNTPYVRNVDAFYENGAFYILTHALSGKMQQISQNDTVAIAGPWFTAQGTGICMGYWNKAENAGIAERMLQVFSAWIHNGHTDLQDKNTCILCIQLKHGVLFANGVRYDIDFTKRSV